jgi:ABC-2 type transport system permease protein
LKPYLAIFKIRVKTLFQYRAAAFAGICTQAFWGVVYLMIFRAFYIESSLRQPISLGQAVTFMWLGQALLQLLPWNTDKEVAAQVRSGNIVYELIRPVHLYGLWFSRSLAMRLVPTALRAVPIFVVGGLFFGLEPPVSGEAFVAFLASITLSLLLSASITTLMMIALFWTISGEGLGRLLPHVAVLFSGMVVPLPLFPSWMQPFLDVQPFRGIMDIPFRLYTGVIPVSEVFYYLAFQLAWMVALIVLGRWLMQKAMRQLVIQGG